jgi:hypothetical protein
MVVSWDDGRRGRCVGCGRVWFQLFPPPGSRTKQTAQPRHAKYNLLSHMRQKVVRGFNLENTR